eukprot:Clim_evm19s210 gene=Clim_evmTU19s210
MSVLRNISNGLSFLLKKEPALWPLFACVGAGVTYGTYHLAFKLPNKNDVILYHRKDPHAWNRGYDRSYNDEA